MVLAEFTITPLVENELRPYIDAAIDVVKRSGLKFEVDAMGTTIEGDLDQVLDVVKDAHNAVKQKGAARVLTEVRIDDRVGAISIEKELKGYRTSV